MKDTGLRIAPRPPKAKEWDLTLGRWVPKGEVARREASEKAARADLKRRAKARVDAEMAAKARALAPRRKHLANIVKALEADGGPGFGFVDPDLRAHREQQVKSARTDLVACMMGVAYAATLQDGQVRVLSDAWQWTPSEMRAEAAKHVMAARNSELVGNYDTADRLKKAAKTLTDAANQIERTK